MVRSEKLIELGNSWFSPKELLGSRHVDPLGVELLKGLHRAKARQTYQTPNTSELCFAQKTQNTNNTKLQIKHASASFWSSVLWMLCAFRAERGNAWQLDSGG